jgi:SAM-dependent methyltransferase
MIDGIDRLYRARFSENERRQRDRLWETLCVNYFQRYVRPTDTVLDLACGYGEFIRHIEAGRRLAVDLNPDSEQALSGQAIEFNQLSSERLTGIADGTVDVCFTSNFFEHLPSKTAMDNTLLEVRRVLRSGGLFVALQPNIKYLSTAYWDFYDHVLPLSHLSAQEAFLKAGFDVEQLVARFLPFTTKSRLPQSPWLVRLYLRIPVAWRLLGRQFLIVGRKPRSA